MKKIFLLIIISLSTSLLFAQAKKVFNYKQRLTFNSIGENDYDLGTTTYQTYSNSIINIEVKSDGTGSLIAYIYGQKKFYLITQCEREANNGTFSFELLDEDDVTNSGSIISIGAYLIVSNNTVQGFKIFKKGKNEAIILTNR